MSGRRRAHLLLPEAIRFVWVVAELHTDVFLTHTAAISLLILLFDNSRNLQWLRTAIDGVTLNLFSLLQDFFNLANFHCDECGNDLC